MRKREKTVYIIAIAIVTAIFVVSIPPEITVEYLEQSDSLKVEEDLPVFSISPYDSLFRLYADTIGWDWKMLAAVAYVESKFDTAAVSAVGARGLMQMMPRTLRSLGVPDSLHTDTRTNVHAGARYLKKLEHIFRRIKDFDERLNFILASYNAGVGQVNDAMALVTSSRRCEPYATTTTSSR